MKHLLIFFLLIQTICCLSQDFEPTQLKFNIHGDTTLSYISADSLLFKQNKMILGWHWGSGRSMTTAIGGTMGHSESQSWVYPFWVLKHDSVFADNTDLVLNIPVVSNKYGLFSPSQSISMQYEPTLLIHEPGNFIIRQDDNTNSIFGFNKIKGYISNNPIDENYNRLLLSTDSLVYETILSEPWPSNAIVYRANRIPYSYQNSNIDTVKSSDYDGSTFYLSINLRRTDTTSTQDTAAVLEIKLPYVLINGSVGDISFQAVPDNDIYAVDTLINNLGIARKLIPAANPNVFYVKRSMLPKDNDYNTNDITISAKFISGILPLNPFFKEPTLTPDTNSIDSLKIKVKYLGNCNVAIEWIRVECQSAMDINRGLYDESIKSEVQKVLTHFTGSDYNNRGIRALRFYTIDELGEPWIWGSFRYLNKLIGNIQTTEINPIYPDLFNYYVNPPDFILSIGTEYDAYLAPPYYRLGASRDLLIGGNVQSHKVLGYKWGFKLFGYADTLNSDYETFVNWTYGHPLYQQNLKWLLDTATLDDYKTIVTATDGFQMHLDKMKYNNYYNSIRYKNLYLDKQFWAQNTLGSDWGFYYITNEPSGDTITPRVARRPDSGEEIRAWIWSNLIMGVKGFMIDREYTGAPIYTGLNREENYVKDNAWTAVGFGNNQDFYDTTGLKNLSGYNFILCDSVGQDYLDINNDFSQLNNFINLDTIPFYLQIPEDRIYLGRKSTRFEFKKVYDLLNLNNTTLINLRLAGWYGKGFKIWNNQDTNLYSSNNIFREIFACLPDTNSNILLDTNRLKIRHPLRRIISVVGGDTILNLPDYESFDSTFFDVTVLRDKSDTTLTGEGSLFVGIQNRRTDPLFLHHWDESCDTCNMMLFLSTAEFDTLVRKGGYIIPWDTTSIFKDSTYWQNLFWKRQGAREIELPFNLNYSNDTNQYALLKITELGVGNEYLDTVWYRQPKYYHKIDTVIGQDKSLIVRLLPGEGKLLKVEILPPQQLQGELTYSNQRKMVGYPILDTNSVIIEDSLYYHLVYNREENDQYKVYYRRSEPVTLTDSMSINSNLKWGPEKSLTDMIYCIEGTDTLYSSTNCKYPSLVVRYDSVSNKSKVYVVFVCEGRQYCLEPADCQTSYVTVVENIINADDTVQNVLPSRAIAHACGDDYNKWGVPMINASRYGNYYVWPDSLKGITSAWKRPCDTVFNANFDFVNSSFQYGWISQDTLPQSLHPSLNTYSRIELDEPDCAVTWQENISPASSNYAIYYSILHYDSISNRVNHLLPDSIKHLNPSYNYNIDSTIVKLSYDNEDSDYPIVFRNIEDDSLLGLGTTFDVMTWQSYYSDSLINCPQPSGYFLDSRSFVVSQTIMYNFLYPTYSGSLSFIKPRSKVLSISNSLLWPNQTQGSDIYSGSSIGNPRAVNLEFVERDVCPVTTDKNPRIWQYPHDFLSFVNLPNNYIDSSNFPLIWTEAKRIHDDAYIPQLAARPFVREYKEWWQNKRVYIVDSSITDITSSSKTFYRGEKGYVGMPFIGYADTLNHSLISPIILDNTRLKLNKEYIYPEITSDREFDFYKVRKSKDTILTDWFKIKTSSDLQFFCLGMDDRNVQMYIERASDKRKTTIRLPEVEHMEFESSAFRLINGGADSYRILFVKWNNQYNYSENLLLLPNPYIFDQYNKLKAEVPVIDLGFIENEPQNNGIQLSVFPNPSDNKVYITATSRDMQETSISDNAMILNITFFDVLGNKFMKFQIHNGVTKEVSVENIPQGVYFIRAETKDSKLQELISPVTKQFIIER